MTAFATAPLLTLPQLAQMALGDLVAPQIPPGATAREAFLRGGVDGVSIDTRTLQPGALFVPLPGSNTDGHRFLDEAFRRGAAAALCEHQAYPAWRGREPGPLVLVDDVTAALQRIARRYREPWPGLLVGVTGSAGKTTTKEMVAAVLSTSGPTLKTRGNLNNQWGVPLTLMELRPEHRSAVVEMAMNAAGEIEQLAAIARPGAAVITNAGRAHVGGRGLGSVEAVAREKAALARAVPRGRPVFAGADSPALLEALEGVEARVVTYGLAPDASVRPVRVQDLGLEGCRFTVAGFPEMRLRMIGLHQVRNALAALAVARELGLDAAAAAAALEAVGPGPGRMRASRSHGAFLLLDHYNANPESMRAALETLASTQASRRIAVLGDMLELGEQAPSLHREAGASVRDAELWVVGEHAPHYLAGAAEAGIAARGFPDKPALARALREALAPGTVILLKASRGAALEELLEGIELEG